MALGTPGGDNQEQTILQAFLSVVEFWTTTGIRTCTRRSNGRASRPLHFFGSFWPHAPGFNKLNVEAHDSRGGLQRAAGPRPRREPAAGVRHVGLRDRRDDRSGDRQSLRGGRSAPRLLCDRVLSGEDEGCIGPHE